MSVPKFDPTESDTERGSPLIVSVALVLVAWALLATAPALACDTALLVIDVQNLWLEEGDWRTIGGDHIVHAVGEVLRDAREASLPIVYVQDTSVAAAYAGAERLAFPEAISPQPGDLVFEKRKRDAFSNPALEQSLREMGVTRLIVSGMASDSCVAATVGGAIERGFDLAVIADAHSSGFGGRKAAFMNTIWAGWGIPLPMSADLDLAGYCPSVDEIEAEPPD